MLFVKQKNLNMNWESSIYEQTRVKSMGWLGAITTQQVKQTFFQLAQYPPGD